MPLGFQSINRGVIAFGFFNIDTDLLLLEDYFIFAPDLCRYVEDVAARQDADLHDSWEVYHIRDRRQIGDLMGAIHGVHFSGFIGDVYKQFPFPKEPEAFKQKPEGAETRPILEAMIERYAAKTIIPFKGTRQKGTIQIGEYHFDRNTFQELIRYVWVGGYPRWRDGIRPDYVLGMKRSVEGSRSWLFAGLLLD